jgi:hypothetical protein
MATRKLRRQNNHTKKRKNVKKGGSIECVYDKYSKKLHITIARGMLDGNLSKIRTVCEKAIRDSSPEKQLSTKSTPEKNQLLKSVAVTHKKSHGFPLEESLTDDIGILNGRRSPDPEDK